MATNCPTCGCPANDGSENDCVDEGGGVCLRVALDAALARATQAEQELATIIAERDAAVSMGTQLERERDRLGAVLELATAAHTNEQPDCHCDACAALAAWRGDQ